MMRSVTFTVEGRPRAKQSFRYSRKGGYTDAGVKGWQSTVAQQAALAMRGRDRFAGPVAVILEFYLPDNHRRDADNLSKGVLDALNGIVFDDDAQVVDLHITKHVRKPAGVWVEVRQEEGDD